jgi:hypothetical protein
VLVESATHAGPPSPLNGERAGVRGENSLASQDSSTASVISRASQVERPLGAPPAPASPPKSFHAQNVHLSVASSKIAVFECCVTSSTRLAPCLPSGARETRVVHRRARGCNAPARSRNRDNARQLCAVVGICKLRNDDRGEWPTASSRPKWLFCRRARAKDLGFITDRSNGASNTTQASVVNLTPHPYPLPVEGRGIRDGRHG